MRDIDIDLNGVDLMTTEALIDRGEVKEAPGILETGRNIGKGIVKETDRFFNNFSSGLNIIKDKIKDDEEIKNIMFNYSLDELKPDVIKRINEYKAREQGESLPYRIWESTSENIIKAGENIANADYWRPEEGIVDIIKRGDLDFTDKITKSLGVIKDVAINNSPFEGFDKDLYLEKTGEMEYQVMEDFKTSWDRIVKKDTKDLSGDVSELALFPLKFFGAPVMNLFDSEVTGAEAENVMTAIDTVFTPVIDAVAKESIKSLGGSDRLSENVSLFIQAIIPAKAYQKQLDGFSASRISKDILKEIQTEIKEIHGLSTNVREAYVEAKKEQYGTFGYVKGVEKFDSILEQAKTKGDVELLNQLKDQVIQFNKIEKAKIVGDIKNNIGVSIDNLADKMGVKLSFMDNGTDVPYLDLSKISFGKGSDKIHAQELNKKAVNDLAKFWSDRGLGDLKKAEVKASVEQYFKELALTEIQKKSFAGDLWNELQLERSKQSASVEQLYNISQLKRGADDLYRKAKEDFENGNITKQEMLKYKRDYQKSLDSYENPKKLEELKYQEALGNMKLVDDGAGELVSYEWTDKGLKYINPKVRSVAVGYHYNRKLKDEVEGKVVDKEIEKTIKTKDLEFEALLNKSVKAINPLHKAYQRSGVTWETFKKNEVEKVLNNKKGLYKLQTEIEASKAGERVFVEPEVGGTPEVIGIDSSFPKWLPSHLRRKDLMENTFKKLEKGEVDIPERYTAQQEIMTEFLKQLDSKLQYLYEADFKKVSDNVWREKTKLQTERLKQSKQVMGAIHKEYKKVKNESVKLEKKVYESRDRLKQTRDKWKEKFQYKADSNKRRRKAIQTLKKAFELSDNDYKKALAGMKWNRSKDFLTFTHEYEFKQFMFALEESVYRIAEQKFEKIALLAKIESKQFSNLQNLLRAYELPTDVKKMEVTDLLKVDKIIDQFEAGDNFITTGLIKRFDILGEDIKTVRQAREMIAQDLGDLYELTPDEFEASLYKARIDEIKQELKDTIELGDKPKRVKLEVELQELESKIREEALKKKIKDVDFKKKETKTTDEKVKADKLIKGSPFDKMKYDSALADQNPLYKFMILEYRRTNIETLSNIQRLEEKLGDKLKAARDSRKKSLLDKLIPTDDHVFKYLEADMDKKVELAKNLTPEELELANFVKEVFNYFRGELTKNKVMDNFMNNYVTNLQKGVSETFKTKGFKAAVKKLFEKEESLIDFGSLGEPDVVLGFEKFFKFSLQRTKDFDPSKDIGKAVMAYAKTYYKKEALDKVIPKVVLYKNLLADSKADKTIIQWLNNKKGITAIPDLQGTGVEKVVNGLKSFISFMDLGFNPVTAAASTGGVTLSNFIGLGTAKYGVGLKRKYSPKGREILKKYEAEIGRNPLWDMGREVLNRPDVTPLEIPFQLSFSMLAQTLQSGLKTAFLAKLSKAEFDSGVVSSKRIAEIFNDLGAVHALPGTQSIYGNTFIGKLFMMYKTWAVPLLYTNGRNASKIINGTATKADMAQFARGMAVPAMIIVIAKNILEEDPDDKFAYHKKRIIQELTSTIGALDVDIWTSNRVLDYVNQTYNNLLSLAKLEEYKQTREGQYEEGDLKGLRKLQKQYSPGWYKHMKTLFEEPTKKPAKSAGGEPLDIGEVDLDLDLDLDTLDLDLGDIDLEL